ncbi:MAG: HEAT repeat domain-containing protein [Candidatus Latescibacterota bacterium]|nr:MAG: HEAT repeat domain-containing protein [Candidatus Latescibacterota bacterium]
MEHRSLQTVFLLLLALVFSVGLTFVTIELPHVVDDFLQTALTTPHGDSHANETSTLKTELFISHFKLRLIGYVCFALMLLAIVVGFATRRSGLATLGAVGFMLPVFAQFASVMFFLSGLGILNVVWLPLLDLSWELQRLGLIIRAPYDLLMWLFRQIGVDGYWPIVYFFLASGLLLFFSGTFAWLSARARKQDVADFWVYRISRHPQYLGWILWSYGVYLLLLRGLYPKRSWGIDASLPWLLSTLVIVGVAMMEELNMQRRFGEAYETYRRSAPFLLPLPGFVQKLFSLPTRLLFKRNEPERKREVVAALCIHAAVLIAASALFYAGGFTRTRHLLAPATRDARMEELAAQLREEPNGRMQYFIAAELVSLGEPAVAYFIPLLQDDEVELRILAAHSLRKIPSPSAVPALVAALDDSVANVRGGAASALASTGCAECVGPIRRLLEDPESWVRRTALRALAELGADEIVDWAQAQWTDSEVWTRVAIIESLGILGARRALPLILEGLKDNEPLVRRAAVVAAMSVGSPDARAELTRASRDDVDWEVRLYATEALKQMRELASRPGVSE